MTRQERIEQMGGYLRRRRRRKWLAPIALNMTPMIDVVFLLLVYFMLVARFGAGGAVLGMEVRESGAGEERDAFALPRRVVRVTVESASRETRAYTVTCSAAEIGDADSIDALVDGLRGSAVFGHDQPISIEPARGAIWEHALDAYESLRRGGFTNAHLAVGGS